MPCKDPARQLRSLRCCHLPAEEQPLHSPPRDSGAYVPELAARIDDDRNLTDGARRCARKLAEYTYRKDRDRRASEITVTWLMKALGKSRRTVQRYLRQLERAGYIAVEVVQARTRMCAGLMIELLAPVMLSALVVTNTFAGDHKLVLDPRAAGLAAAAISILLRAPLLVTVTVAAVTAALIRAL